ncbi:hypothetical protein MNBD_BACTEROID04-190, partial [hydrothermal vent metagenome]
MKIQKQKFTNLNNSKVVIRILKNVMGLLVLVLFASCIDNNDSEVFEPQPDGEALAARFENNRVNAVQEFTLDASIGGIITGTEGTKVTFQPNSFGLNGTP